MQTSQNVPKTKKKYTQYLKNPNVNNMFLEPIESAQVIDITNKLKPKFSSGHDDISTKLLNSSANYTYNQSVLSNWCSTNVTKNSQSHPNLKKF